MPGPTSHFGGHAIGNIASMTSKKKPSNPKKAAKEWLEKVCLVQSLGANQLVLPPHRRPLTHHEKQPTLQHLSSGFIWMANAGHFIPATDSPLAIHQFIPANMTSSIHRKTEHRFHGFWLGQILKNTNHIIHSPLKESDEGAANTIRLWKNNQSLLVLVHGHKNTVFPSRQSKESLKELHSLANLNHYFMLQQQSNAINHGVFHNDVISFGFQNFLFCHEHSFEDQNTQLSRLNQQFKRATQHELNIIQIKDHQLTLAECIDTYLFNSQIILMNGKVILLCPSSVKKNPKSLTITHDWLNKQYIHDVKFIDIQSSLMNGGGPACLRLCLYLSDSDIQEIPHPFWLTSKKASELTDIINTEYPSTFNLNSGQENATKYRDTVKKIERLFYESSP